MTPEERSLLERTHKLAEENNEILRSIRRSNRFSAIMRIVYWSVIIILSFGAYYFIQPYVDTMMSAYGQLQGNIQGIQNDVSTARSAAASFRDILK